MDGFYDKDKGVKLTPLQQQIQDLTIKWAQAQAQRMKRTTKSLEREISELQRKAQK